MVKVRSSRGVRAGVAIALVLGGGATLLAACFPDYEIGGGDSGGDDGGRGEGGSSGGDSAVPDGTTGNESAAGDSAVHDSTLVGDGSSSGGDGSAGQDSGSSSGGGDSSVPPSDASFDGNPLANMVLHDGGTFYFQVLNGTYVDAQATLDYTVAIDRTEVTVGEFSQWVGTGVMPAQGASLDPGGAYSSVMKWDPAAWGTTNADILAQATYQADGGCSPGFTSSPIITLGTNANYPITCVSWPTALAFCAWEHKRLPTETEWRYFATAQGSRQPYPWGPSPTPGAGGCTYAIGDFPAGSGCGFPVVVGSALAGVSKDGVDDLVGSLSEWVWDWLPSSYAYPNNAGTDYAGPSAGAGPWSRMWMNSDFTSHTDVDFQSSLGGPGSSSANGGYDNCGFRCAKSLP